MKNLRLPNPIGVNDQQWLMTHTATTAGSAGGWVMVKVAENTHEAVRPRWNPAPTSGRKARKSAMLGLAATG
ncbi:hypothetical protein MIC97_20440 [Aquamicrobium sp. NLF2-7]|uniref:hypothetical protein n=1 Tax=Aquamicrobium sp. NLF2-7 TaxID=2918753 RepID=UPI001EFA8EFD|nr:hypothetical protein [Aquamicrobium sp. NLF2-7]MCG8273856.1 hypothetical protein [Aquamicrobium sp. NLF2-7]